MNAISTIASNTYRQVVRQRLFFNVGIFGLFLILLSLVMAHVTFGESARMVRGLGLGGTAIAIDLMALLVGVSLIHQEIDRKTLFVVLARPVRRWQYFVGRFVGLLGAILTALVAFGLVYAVALTMSFGELRSQDIMSLVAIIPEASIIGAFGMVLSAFSTPTLSAGIGLGMWIVAASTDDFVKLAERADPSMQNLSKGISYILPGLARFDFREAAVHAIPIAMNDFAFSMIYGLLWVVALLAIGSLILSRREML